MTLDLDIGRETRIVAFDAFGLYTIMTLPEWLAAAFPGEDPADHGVDVPYLVAHLRAGRVVALGGGAAPITRVVRYDVTDRSDDNTVWV